MDYEVQRSARRCAATGREFAPGEEFYSALVAEGAQLRRYDYAASAWQGPPPAAIGWWKAAVPDRATARSRQAPNDVLLGFFEELADKPDRQDMRYVLALLLVRRRVMRLDETERDGQGREMLVLYCPRRDATYRTPVAVPDESRVGPIQDELARLLFANAA